MFYKSDIIRLETILGQPKFSTKYIWSLIMICVNQTWHVYDWLDMDYRLIVKHEMNDDEVYIF